jgi:predicted O-linked N-acetylglucosamine transferase (SPINDLY family)
MNIRSIPVPLTSKGIRIDPRQDGTLMNLNAELKKAVDRHRSGDLSSAGAMYDALLKAAPGHARIWHLAGVLSHQIGDLEKACRLIARAVNLTPDDSACQISLGAALKADGKLKAAREAFEKAACLAPADAELINELGDIAMAVGDYRQAVRHFRRAVAIAPDSAVYHFNLGLALRHQGSTGRALNSFRQALYRDPRLKQAHSAIGNLLQDRGDYQLAINCYRRVLELSPGDHQAWYNMGHAARSQGDPDTAAECYRKVLALKPEHAEAHNNLGLIHKENGNYSDAHWHFESALAHRPDLVEAQYNLGVVEQLRGDHEAGLECFRKALLIRTDYAPAKWMWHLSLPILYETPDAIDHYRNRFAKHLSELIENTPLQTPKAVAAAVEGIGSMTNFYLQYQGRNDRDLQTQYGQFVCRVMAKAYPRWCRPRPAPPYPGNSKIRVGYVSSFMRAHTIGEFLAGWLEHHSREEFEFYCYHIGEQTDGMTARFQKRSDKFYQLGNRLEETARTILDDRLHILVYTDIGMNPLATQLAALRLAPVQCKGWGHPVTTGLPTIDYYLSSDAMEPPNAQDHYSESLIRLPNLALAYRPPALPKEVKTRADYGLTEDAFVYLNSQSLFKLLPQHDDIYPRIAAEVSNAQFAFLAHRDEEITRLFIARLSRAFRGYGLVFEEHCRLLPRQNFPDFLGLHMVSNVLLDSLDWSGGKTSLEAISCGLPIVTCPGNMMRGRHAYAMLSMMGIDATIASDKDEYVEIAAKLCRDVGFYERVGTDVQRLRTKLYADAIFINATEEFYRRASAGERLKPKRIRGG